MWQVLRGQQVHDAEIAIGLPDGTNRSYLVNGQPLRTDTTGRAGGVRGSRATASIR